MKAKRLALAGLVSGIVAMSAQAPAATAMSVGMDFKGYVTMLNAADGVGFRNPSAGGAGYLGYRTPISGHMVMDITETGMVGTATFVPFKFSGVMSSGRDITFVPSDNLFGLPIPSSTLLVGNMLFDFGTNVTGIPVSIVLDMGNLSTALMNSKVGDVIGGTMRAASDDTVFETEDAEGNIVPRTLPLGPVVVATTTWDTTDVDTDHDGQPGPIMFNTNPSGTIPLLVDTTLDMTNGDIGVGGSPMKIGPFAGFSPNFDITEVTVTCVSALGSCSSSGVAVPAVPLAPKPLEPVQDSVSGLVKSLSL